MNDTRNLRIGGCCALLAALCAVAGASISNTYGLGGQNLPVADGNELAMIATSESQYLLREWLYLLVAIFAIGEGVGLYFLLRKESDFAIWALVAWIAGLVVGIVQDAAIIALLKEIGRAHVASSISDALQVTASLTMETIKIQQFAANVLTSGVAIVLFCAIGIRSKKLPIWLCGIGFITALTVGWAYGIANLFFPDYVSMLEYAFVVMVVFDFSVGVILLRQNGSASAPAD